MGNFAVVKEELPPIPEEFRTRVLTQFGSEEGETLLKALDEEPSVSLRLNTLKIPCKESPYEGSRPVGWADGGFWLTERPRFTSHPWLHGGGFYVQEAASMWISTLALRIVEEEGRRDLKVLDLCAAPGGKSIGLAEALGPEALLISNEVDSRRATVLKENMIKWGHPGSIVTSGPASEWGKVGGEFDILVTDVPCSGEGMMRKESIARTQWSPRLVEQCAALQRDILQDSLPALKSGGWLIYSTCTFNRAENEDNIAWLQEEQGLMLVGEPRRFLPGRDGGEGLFMALLRKDERSVVKEIESGRRFGRKSGKNRGGGGAGSRSKCDANMLSRVREGLKGEWEWEFDRDVITALRPMGAELLAMLPDGIKVLKKGVEAGEIKGKDFVPSHQMALNSALKVGAYPEVELRLEDARRYLCRENIVLPESAPKGYVIVTYSGVRLGFVKNLGNRANNLYPKEWKIRSL